MLFNPLLQSLDGLLHLLCGPDVGQGLEIDKGPDLILNQLGLEFLEHGMQLFVIEDETVVLRYCPLR